MGWPNSVSAMASVQPAPSTFPGVGRPANDNWRGPRITPGRPPSIGVPANSNKLPTPRAFVGANPRPLRLPKLPLLGPLGAFALGFEIGYGIGLFIFQQPVTPGAPIQVPGWVHDTFYARCSGAPPPTYWGRSWSCSARSSPVGALDASTNAATWGQHPTGSWQRVDRYYRTGPSQTAAEQQQAFQEAYDAQTQPVKRVQPGIRTAPVRAPYPGFYPPLLEPLWAPMPKATAGTQRPILPQYPSKGYGTNPRPAPRPNPLRSHKPPRRTKEKKARLKDYKVGRLLEGLVGSTTEAFDHIEAVFSALPRWRIYAIYNSHRKVELKRENGFVVGARYRHIALTPVQKLEYIAKYFSEVDAVEAVQNIMIMNNQDRFWGAASQRMGLEKGPAGEYIAPPEDFGEYDHYYPGISTDSIHNMHVLESESGLALEEYRAMQERYNDYLTRNGEWVDNEWNSGVIW